MTDSLAARWRSEFPIVDTCTYLVSHSLGAMPRRAVDSVHAFADVASAFLRRPCQPHP